MEIQLLSNVRDIKDFVSEQNKNYDIYAYVISGWHLGTVYSYLLSLGKHVKRKVLILMSTDRINNEMIKSFPQFEIDYIRTIDMSDVTNNLKLNKILKLKEDGNKQKVTVLTPFGYSLGFFNLILQFLEGHSIDFVKYDEGAGSYISEYAFNMSYYQRKISKALKVRIKLLIKNLYIQVMKLRGITFSSFFLFKVKKKSLLINTDTVMYFREYYNGKFPHIDNIQHEDSVLILKDLLNEVMTESNILDFYVNLVKKVKKSGMRVYFKKHPLDNNDSFDNILNNMGVTILDPKVDTELILKSINPKYIYSGTSTVSFTIPVLFDRKVYNYSMIFRKYKTEKHFKKTIKIIKRQLNKINNVVFIESFDEIKIIL